MKMRIKTKKLVLALGAIMICALTLTFASSRLVDRHKTDADNGAGEDSVIIPPAPTLASPLSRDSQASAGTNMAGQHLTGRSLSYEEATRDADSIIVGRIISLGERSMRAPGQLRYRDVIVAVLRTIKGDVPEEEVTLSLTVRTLPPSVAEETPEVGQQYIIFLQIPAPEAIRGIKLLHSTEENLGAVTGLVTPPIRNR